MSKEKNFTNTLNILKDEIVQLKNKIDENKFIFQIIEKTNIPIFVINKDKKIIYCNPEMENLISPTKNIINKNYSNVLYSQKEVKKAETIVNELFQNGHALKNIHLMYKKGNGKANSFVTSVTKLFTQKGGNLILFQLLKPVAEIFVEAFQRLFSDSDNLGVQIIDSDGFIIYSNSITTKLLFNGNEDLLGKNIKEIFAFKEDKKLKEISNAILNGKEIDGKILELRNGNENLQYIYVIIKRFQNLGEWFNICFEIDITSVESQRLKLSELNLELSSSLDSKKEELKAQEESFRALAENSEDVIMRFDKDYKHLYVSPSISNLLDLSPEDMVGKSHAELGFPKDLVEVWENAIQKVFDTGEVNRIEFQLPTGVWIDWMLMAEKDNNGEVKYVMTSSRDITDIKHYQKRMEKYSETLSKEVQKKTLDVVKHNKKLEELLLEKNRIQKNLQEREKLYSTLVNSSFDGIVMIDLKGVVLFCNPSALDLLNLKQEKELLNKSVFDFIVKNEWQRAKRAFIKLIKSREKLHAEFRIVNKNKKLIHVDIVASLVTDSFDSPESIILFVRDVTEKKLAAQKIIESEQKYRELFENSPIGLMILDINGNIVDVNVQGSKILAYSPHELIGENISKIAVPQYRDKVQENIFRIVTGDKLNHIVENITKDGRRVYLNLYERLTISDSGEKQIFVSFEDITEKVNKDNEIIKKEYRHRTLFGHSPNGIIVLNEQGEILDVNSAFTRSFGFEALDVVKKHISFVFNYMDRQSWDLKIRETMNGEDLVEKVEFKGKGNKTRIIEFNGVRIPLYDKEFGALLITKDISEEVERINKLEEAKKIAERADKLKSDFLAQISHEIRSPLTNVQGFIQLLKDDLLSSHPEYKVVFGSIGMSINRIFRTVELILNSAEMKRGTYEPKFEKIELIKGIITPVYEEYKSFAEHRNLKLKLVLETRSASIKGDHFSLYQIFVNLVDNAIKYTKQGEIVIRVYRLQKKICVDVKDSGIGIDEKFIPNLFDVFTQEESGYSRKFDGTGLGLSLVKDYCKLNKAKISVKSKKGKGSVFTVKF